MTVPKRVMHVTGARPNFVKLAAVVRALRRAEGLQQISVHTGQHYDDALSAAFFRDLAIPEPDFHLEVGSGTHAYQTAEVMVRLEKVLDREPVDLVLVYGDVNSTVAAALVAAKRGILVGHVEAGLRSRDWTMPEEINRVVTDRLADLLFTPSRDADQNLQAEGVPADRVHFVGNVMVDTLLQQLPRARERRAARRLELEERGYLVVTLHRPSNVDSPDRLKALLEALVRIGQTHPVIFPAHPRTGARLQALAGVSRQGGLRLVDPMSYLDMLSLVATSKGVLTDSGGLQEETTVLGIPCVTLRPNTERPVTISQGTNQLAPEDPGLLPDFVRRALEPRGPAHVPEFWDGNSGTRIAEVIARRFSLSPPPPVGGGSGT